MSCDICPYWDYNEYEGRETCCCGESVAPCELDHEEADEA